MCCFVILLLSNEMQMSVRRFSAIPHGPVVKCRRKEVIITDAYTFNFA